MSTCCLHTSIGLSQLNVTDELMPKFGFNSGWPSEAEMLRLRKLNQHCMVQIMAYRLAGDKVLSRPVLTYYQVNTGEQKGNFNQHTPIFIQEISFLVLKVLCTQTKHRCSPIFLLVSLLNIHLHNDTAVYRGCPRLQHADLSGHEFIGVWPLQPQLSVHKVICYGLACLMG